MKKNRYIQLKKPTKKSLILILSFFFLLRITAHAQLKIGISGIASNHQFINKLDKNPEPYSLKQNKLLSIHYGLSLAYQYKHLELGFQPNFGNITTSFNGIGAYNQYTRNAYNKVTLQTFSLPISLSYHLKLEHKIQPVFGLGFGYNKILKYEDYIEREMGKIQTNGIEKLTMSGFGYVRIVDKYNDNDTSTMSEPLYQNQFFNASIHAGVEYKVSSNLKLKGVIHFSKSFGNIENKNKVKIQKILNGEPYGNAVDAEWWKQSKYARLFDQSMYNNTGDKVRPPTTIQSLSLAFSLLYSLPLKSTK